MNPTEDRERLEQVEDLLERLRDANESIPVIVEGPKDQKALRNLGLGGTIIKVNHGGSVFALCETIGRDHDEAIVLMDWDRTGGQLTRLLKEGLDANQVTANTEYRRELARLTRKDISDVEGMDTYLRNLRDVVGVGNGSGLP